MKVNKETAEQIKIQEKYLKNKIFALISKEVKAAKYYNPGDIVEDHCRVSKVMQRRVKINYTSYTYEVIYECVQLTKQLKPFKNNNVIITYHCNIERIIKKS